MFIPSLTGNPPLVGRERELALLRQHVTAALDGHGSLVLISGEAGIGKTALAETLCREAAKQGMLVLVGRCFDLMETSAYGPWLYLFERYIATEMAPLPPAFSQPGRIGEVADQATLFRQVLDFVSAAATHQPLIMLLDDVQWADPASLDLLRFLAQSARALPLLVLATYRSDEVTRQHRLHALLPLLVREATAERLDLRRLDAAAARDFVRVRYDLPETDTDRLVTYLEARAEGNALFLGELLRSLEESDTLRRGGGRWLLSDLTHMTLPLLLQQVIDGRLRRLDAESQRLLAVAAVIGHEVPLDVWAVVAEADEDAIVALVERSEEAHLLAAMSDGQRVQFTHALVREAVYESVQPTRRRHLHRAVGEALMARLTAKPDAVADHFLRAGDARATEWLMWAGEQAEQAYAWLTAATRYETALAMPDARNAEAGERGWLLYRLAVLRRFADTAQGIVSLDEVARLAEQTGDAVLAAYVLYSRGHLRCLNGNYRQGIPLVEAGVAALQALPDAHHARLTRFDIIDARRSEGTLANWLINVGRYAEAQALGEKIIASPSVGAAEGSEEIRRTSAYFALGVAYANLGQPELARRALAVDHEGNRAIGYHHLVGGRMMQEMLYVVLPYYADHLAERQRVVSEAALAWTQAHDMQADFPANAPRLPLLVIEGQWDEAYRLSQTIGQGTWVDEVFGVAMRAFLASARGETALAWSIITNWMPDGPRTNPGDIMYATTLSLQRVATMLALDAGDIPTATAWVTAHDRWVAWAGVVLGQSEGHLLRARWHRAMHENREAFQEARQALARATEPQQPLALLAAHRLLGELEREAGRYEDATAHLNEALALADACTAPYERALTLLALAHLHTATGAGGEARALLDEARAICALLGARPALARMDALATKIHTARVGTPAYATGLSAREIEVLHLVAAGRTNREIAEVLFLSERTVEVHVRHILTKTNTENRTAAAIFAREHDLA